LERRLPIRASPPKPSRAYSRAGVTPTLLPIPALSLRICRGQAVGPPALDRCRLETTMRFLRTRSAYCVDELDRLPAVLLEPVFAAAVRSLVALEPVVDDPAGCEMPSAAIVCESSCPVACSPFAFWNLRNAACVCGPILPSTAPASKPCELSAC